MYWPDDLPMLKDCTFTKTGRRNYHGKYELIASNHMEILNVCSFAGLASVAAWKENDDDEAQTGLYWRQTFDYRTGQLSVSLLKDNFGCNWNLIFHNRNSRSTASARATITPTRSSYHARTRTAAPGFTPTVSSIASSPKNANPSTLA
jgi:hypothetical protein